MTQQTLAFRVEHNDPTPDIASFDLIIVNSSAGKDSQAMLDYVTEQADAAGVRDRIVVVHADLGDVEWEGTRELAERQARHYGHPFEVVRHRKWRDLLERIESRGQWPSSTTRYCTSEFKTGQVRRFMTAAVNRLRDRFGTTRPIRILNCLGIRAQESPARAKKEPLSRDSASNGKREVVRWLPIFRWTEREVWQRIEQSGVEHHRAYDQGQTRLSCRFCVLASRDDLVNSIRLNRDYANRYLEAEQRMDHTFQSGTSFAELVEEADALDAQDAPLNKPTSTKPVGCPM